MLSFRLVYTPFAYEPFDVEGDSSSDASKLLELFRKKNDKLKKLFQINTDEVVEVSLSQPFYANFM